MSILHSVLITVNQVPPHYSYLFSCLTLTITCIIATGSLGLYLFLIDNSFQTEHAYVLVDHVFCCEEKVNKHHLDAWIKPFIVTVSQHSGHGILAWILIRLGLPLNERLDEEKSNTNACKDLGSCHQKEQPKKVLWPGCTYAQITYAQMWISAVEMF